MTKKELREKYKLLREELDQLSVDDLSKACFSIFFKNFHFQGKNIGIFLPITSKKEPNTFLLFSEFSTENINYYAPKIDELSDEMKFYSISKSDQIEFGLYKIPEPVTGKKIEIPASIVEQLQFIKQSTTLPATVLEVDQGEAADAVVAAGP